ncbi:hypothetical protein LGM42_23820 [Burkholderia sp. AU39826]|uniref:hypothetical protein n=1 Tax=Burkholderia sp. AU39826 TaxID=2879634 RepID=UPI001CF16C9D|nr:hypothetical protein [Burkholderia sp. AU39826]MCA7972906.1 hypothetical protein [Burkholderia sp. AU39826]
MKKLALAIAASACAMSAYAGKPQPIDLNVQLAGTVPTQDVFKVTPVGWENSREVKIKPDDGWNGIWLGEGLSFQVKSSYGAIHMKLTLTSGGESMTTGNWYLLGEDGISKIGVRRDVIPLGGKMVDPVNDEKMEVASKDVAATGGNMQLNLGVYFDKDIPMKRGMTYAGAVSAVFETALDE